MRGRKGRSGKEMALKRKRLREEKGFAFLPKAEVIKLLSEGWLIDCERNEVYGSRDQLVYSSKTYTILSPDKAKKHCVHHSTIIALQKDFANFKTFFKG